MKFSSYLRKYSNPIAEGKPSQAHSIFMDKEKPWQKFLKKKSCWYHVTIKSLFRNLVYHSQVWLWVTFLGHKQVVSLLHYSHINLQLQSPLLLHSLQSLLKWVCNSKFSHFLVLGVKGGISSKSERRWFCFFSNSEEKGAWKCNSIAMKHNFVHPEAEVQEGNAGHQKHHPEFKTLFFAPQK